MWSQAALGRPRLLWSVPLRGLRSPASRPYSSLSCTREAQSLRPLTLSGDRSPHGQLGSRGDGVRGDLLQRLSGKKAATVPSPSSSTNEPPVSPRPRSVMSKYRLHFSDYAHKTKHLFIGLLCCIWGKTPKGVMSVRTHCFSPTPAPHGRSRPCPPRGQGEPSVFGAAPARRTPGGRKVRTQSKEAGAGVGAQPADPHQPPRDGEVMMPRHHRTVLL